MLPTEAINRIRVLSERGMGSKAIAKSTGISRNTVRKYLSHFQTLTPISSEVQRPSRLDAFWDEGTKNGPDRSALLGHNFVYQETKSHGFYSSYFHQRIPS